MQAYAGMSRDGVTLSYAIAADVPDVVMLDTLRVKQLFINGVTNALKLTARGFVQLQVLLILRI